MYMRCFIYMYCTVHLCFTSCICVHICASSYTICASLHTIYLLVLIYNPETSNHEQAMFEPIGNALLSWFSCLGL